MIKLKKHLAGDSIFDIIISKFYDKKKLYLIILLKVDKTLKIDFYYTISGLIWLFHCK